MDWDRVEGNWKEAKGKIKQKWVNSPTTISRRSMAAASNWRVKSNNATDWPKTYCEKMSTIG
jgi:hypothetical protein